MKADVSTTNHTEHTAEMLRNLIYLGTSPEGKIFSGSVKEEKREGTQGWRQVGIAS
jgi:hypothetical protein